MNLVSAKDLVNHIRENLLTEPYDGLDMATNLFDTGILDSFGVIELVDFIEKNCGIKLEQKHLKLENFASVNAIVEFLSRIES
jgi:acyl carrier protein